MKVIKRDPFASTSLMGLIPYFLIEDDPRPAREQFHERYAHGGGWNPNPKFKVRGEHLQYPGDPPLTLLFEIQFRDERILVYDRAFVAIHRPGHPVEVARMD
jgi:hypothetical protein